MPPPGVRIRWPERCKPGPLHDPNVQTSSPQYVAEGVTPRAPTTPASPAEASVLHLRSVLTRPEFTIQKAAELAIHTVAQVAHLTTPPRKLSDCGTAS